MLADTFQKIQTDEFGAHIVDASKIDINQVTLKISKVAEISEPELQRIFEIFNKFKFVVLDCEPLPNPQENLLGLKKYFGSIKRHKRSDKNGIVSVENLGYSLTTADQISATNQMHPIHTDGSFDIAPPKVVAMQCEIPSKNGGLSQIVYAQSVYEYLMENHPQELHNLFTYPLTITRGNQTATRTTFVKRESRISMTFRLDSVISITIYPQLENAYNIIKKYVNNFANQVIFKLKKNQIILLDNTSVLHGRTSFPDNEIRKLNRLWFDGNSQYNNYLEFGFIPQSNLLVREHN